MMRIKSLFLPAFFCGIGLCSFSQTMDFHINHGWADAPALHKIHAGFDSSSAVCILDDRQTEYKTEGKEIVTYYTYHKIVAIKDDKGIEMFNKMYIPVSENTDVTGIKARTILKNGKVINVDSTKINQIQDNGKDYKIFAFDGLEKGAEIEFLYVIRRGLFLFGGETYQNSAIPCQEARFALIAPSHLRFSVKGYNGVKVSGDSLIDGKRIIVGYDTDIPELAEEKYAYRNKYLKRIDFKLSYNLDVSTNIRLYTWKDLAKQTFSKYTTRAEKDEKILDAFVEQMKTPAALTETEKIIFAEDYIKTNVNIDRKLIAQDANMLPSVIKNKAANLDGIVKLFSAVFDKLNVNYQIVFPSDRSGTTVDEELEDWNKLDDVLFYFPAASKFLSPMNTELRYPYIPFDLAATRGLFLKSTTIGSFKTAVGVWGDIKMEPFSEHAQNVEQEISFNATADTVLIKSKQIFNGYGAANIRPVYVFLPKDKQDEVTIELIKPVVNSNDITDTKVTNTKLTDMAFHDRPLIVAGDAKSTQLLENAGKKILFKVGELLGPQVEMYQEKPRQMPVELNYPHVLNRKILIHIPAGYSIENIKDLDFNVSYKENEEVTVGFVTAYTLKGNDLELNIYETYKKVNYPLSAFENFKKVINASADFNKITLVLKKDS